MPRAEGRHSETRKTVLVVARPSLANLVSLCLVHCGCAVAVVHTVAAARAQASAGHAASIVDVDLEEGTGLGLLEGARACARIALVHPRGIWSSFEAFARGADQVVAVPFTPDELVIRLRELLRRFGQALPLTRSQGLEGLEISLDERVVVGSRTIALSPALNSLLYFVCANRESALPLEQLRESVWGFGALTTRQTIERTVAQLGRLIAARPAMPGG